MKGYKKYVKIVKGTDTKGNVVYVGNLRGVYYLRRSWAFIKKYYSCAGKWEFAFEDSGSTSYKFKDFDDCKKALREVFLRWVRNQGESWRKDNRKWKKVWP